MIRTLLTTTAITAMMTAGVMAQAAPATPMAPAAPMESPTTPMAPGAAPMEAPAPANNLTPAGTANDTMAAQTSEVDGNFDMDTGYTAADSDNVASEIIDQTVYSAAGDEGEDIGKITDLVLGEDGSVVAAIIGVGGFLGIGEKSVAVNYADLQFTVAADNTERWVLPTTAEALTSAPDFVWTRDEPVDASAPAGGMAPAGGAAPAGGMAPAATPAQ